MPICLRLFEQDIRLAASRTLCTAGRSSPTKTAIIAITTSNSISVNALRLCMKCLPGVLQSSVRPSLAEYESLYRDEYNEKRYQQQGAASSSKFSGAPG